MNIGTFEKLQELIVAEQLKKHCSADYKQRYILETLTDPVKLVGKFYLYENLRTPQENIYSRNITAELVVNL